MKKPDKNRHESEKQIEQETAPGAAAAEVDAAEPVAEESFVDISALVAERNAAQDQLLRTLAEFDNYRKRVAREHDRTRKLASESIVRDLLPVLDNLERALEHVGAEGDSLAQGIQMVLNQFGEVLGRHGLRQIPALNAPFDPNIHEAMLQVASNEVPPGHVVQEFMKGYKLGDFIIRPAKVVVSKGAPEDEPGDAGEDAAQAGAEQ